MLMKPTYEKLVVLNPYLKKMGKQKVEDLVEAIQECGYEWNTEHEGFWHPKIKKGIKTSGLDMFTAESLKNTFNTSWNNEDWQKENSIRKVCVKFFMFSILLFLVSLLAFIFIDWRVGLTGVLASISIGFISEKIKMNTLKSADDYVDPKQIIWCKTCKYYRKIKGYEDDLWQQENLPSDSAKIPCEKYSETQELWSNYFSMPTAERALYPKECPSWKK